MFLHGKIYLEVYVAQVSGFESPREEYFVWLLNKSLYGTCQAPQQWKQYLVKILAESSVLPSKGDESLFLSSEKDVVFHIHVYNGFMVGKEKVKVKHILQKIGSFCNIKVKKKTMSTSGLHLRLKS